MQADKLALAVITAVGVVCLLFAGRAHGLNDGYVPVAAAEVSQQVDEPLATNQNKHFLPQPEVMPMPTHLFKRPGFAVYAPQKETKQPGTDADLAGAFGGYFPQPTKTEPEPETTTEPEPKPTAEMTTEPEPTTPTAPGQGDFYRTGETPITPELPAKGLMYKL